MSLDRLRALRQHVREGRTFSWEDSLWMLEQLEYASTQPPARTAIFDVLRSDYTMLARLAADRLASLTAATPTHPKTPKTAKSARLPRASGTVSTAAPRRRAAR